LDRTDHEAVAEITEAARRLLATAKTLIELGISLLDISLVCA
jgi:hypothetical protein